MFALAFLAFIIIYCIVNVVLIAHRNKRAHRFFQERSPKLPVLPNPRLFSGHLFQVSYSSKNWTIIEGLHKIYGPTFGYFVCDQPWVSTKDLDLIKLIEVDQANKHINRSKFGLPFEEFEGSIFQVEDEDWRRVRTAIAQALSTKKVKSDEVSSDIKDIVDRLASSLDRKVRIAELETGKRSFVLDVHDTCQRYSLALIFLITYKRDNMVNLNAESDALVELLNAAAKDVANPLVTLCIMFPFLLPVGRFLTQFTKLGQLKTRIIDYIVQASDINRIAREQHQRVQRRLSQATGTRERCFSELKSQGAYRRRLVDNIIDAFIEKKITYSDFVGSTLFLLTAAFETTADTITCLLWQLARQPEIQEKLRSTIQQRGVDDDYVLWCIKETVRWHPAFPVGTGRVLGEDVLVNGELIPKGTFLMPSTHSIHHDHTIWPDAHLFKPDRWRYVDKMHPAAFMGFGLGPRNCLGAKLAIQEIKLAIQMLLGKFRIEKCDETTENYDFSCPGMVYTVLEQPIMLRLVALS